MKVIKVTCNNCKATYKIFACNDKSLECKLCAKGVVTKTE